MQNHNNPSTNSLVSLALLAKLRGEKRTVTKDTVIEELASIAFNGESETNRVAALKTLAQYFSTDLQKGAEDDVKEVVVSFRQSQSALKELSDGTNNG